MISTTHSKILRECSKVVLDQEPLIKKFKKYNAYGDITKAREVANKILENLNQGIAEYNQKREGLKKSELNEVFEMQFRAILTVYVETFRTLSEVRDNDYATIDRTLDKAHQKGMNMKEKFHHTEE